MSRRDCRGRELNQRVQRHLDGSKERWRDVIGWQGYYRVSDRGRVKSVKRVVPMCDGRTYKVREKIIKTSGRAGPCGYTLICLSRSGRYSHLLVHRLVLEAFVGPCPKGMECCHWDGDKSNNRLENLRWDSREGNRADSTRLGMSRANPPGEGHWNAKLTEEQVRIIRRRALAGERPCTLCKEFHVNEATIRDIRNRKSWKHI